MCNKNAREKVNTGKKKKKTILLLYTDKISIQDNAQAIYIKRT